MTDHIVSRPATEAYRQGWERIWGKVAFHCDVCGVKIKPGQFHACPCMIGGRSAAVMYNLQEPPPCGIPNQQLVVTEREDPNEQGSREASEILARMAAWSKP